METEQKEEKEEEEKVVVDTQWKATTTAVEARSVEGNAAMPAAIRGPSPGPRSVLARRRRWRLREMWTGTLRANRQRSKRRWRLRESSDEAMGEGGKEEMEKQIRHGEYNTIINGINHSEKTTDKEEDLRGRRRGAAAKRKRHTRTIRSPPLTTPLLL